MKTYLLIGCLCFALSLSAKHHEKQSPNEKLAEKMSKLDNSGDSEIKEDWNGIKKFPFKKDEGSFSIGGEFNRESYMKKFQERMQQMIKSQDFSEKEVKQGWDGFADFAFDDEEFREEKKNNSKICERKLFEDEHNDVTLRAEKDEKGNSSVSVTHEWNSD